MRPLEPGLSLRSYRLERRLGYGAVGQVWLARDTRGRAVALKARARKGGADEQSFRQEFEKLRTLRVPSVVRVLDTGADQGYVFFTMEVAQGVAFDKHVQQAGDLAERARRAAASGAQVARALAGVHRLGLAHRDIKPANVMVDEDGRVTVLDFGTVRFGAAADSSSELMGTVAYMAPEQRIGLPHDQQVDLYALGATLHESLSGVAAARWKPGRPRQTLALLGRDVPLALAWLVDRLLALDPVARPSAEEAEAVLTAIAEGRALAAAPWPGPPAYVGDAATLLDGDGVVLGELGTGRRRLVQEARWQWYRRGYRSIAGVCVPDRPFSALRDVLRAVFADRNPDARRALAGAQAPLLQAVWPELPVPVPVARAAPWPPDPEAVAEALAAVLERIAPVAVVLWDVDDADIGTSAVLPLLVDRLPERVRLWATAQHPVADLPELHPAPWHADQEAAAVADLLPAGATLEGPPGRTPLASCARAWRALATWRGEPGPTANPPIDLDVLSILEEPFPLGVAEALGADVEALMRAGLLVPRQAGPGAGLARSGAAGDDEPTETTNLFRRRAAGEDVGTPWLAFADRGTRRIARARLAAPADAHARAAGAWRGVIGVAEAPLLVIAHSLRSGQTSAQAFEYAIRLELQRGNPREVDRWLQLRDLHLGRDEDFLAAYARMYADFELRPGSVPRVEIKALGRRAPTAEDRGWIGTLLLMHEARQGDREHAREQGRAWSDQLAGRHPEVASWMRREVALLRLGDGDVPGAVQDCQAALALARAAARADRPDDLRTAEVNAATTLSAALIYADRLDEAAELCSHTAERCRQAGRARGEGAMLANAAISRLYKGDRAEAAELAARCRAAQPRHRDPLVLAICALTQGRLAVERGDLAASRTLLDEAMTTGQALGQGRLLAEVWALTLESATQSADVAEAQRALATYGTGGVGSNIDPWPAALARWLWLTGDLDGALRATHAPRTGHSARLATAERCRLLLVGGDYEEARRQSAALTEDAQRVGMDEVALFARLVNAAARGAPDPEAAPLVRQTRQSRWVHLYLGALHLDAIRRQLRGENVGALVRRLRARSRDLGHRLYEALAREDGW